MRPGLQSIAPLRQRTLCFNGRYAGGRVDRRADVGEGVIDQFDRNAGGIGYRDRTGRADEAVPSDDQTVRREIVAHGEVGALGAVRYNRGILRAKTLGQRIAPNDPDSAIGNLDVEDGVADTAAGSARRAFAGIDLIVDDGSLRGAAFHIVPDQLAAKQTFADGECRRLIDINAMGETADIGIAVVYELRIIDRDVFRAIVALHDAGLILMDQAVLDVQRRRCALGVLIAN